jgi:predicted esterase
MKKIQLDISGVFGKKKIRSELVLSGQENNFLIIFFHGCCGTVYDSTPTTYQLLSQHLAKEEISCAFFQTSRWIEKGEIVGLSFSEFVQKAFKGKTFQNEIEDSNRAVSEIIQEYKKKTKKNPRIIFVGFSLGGLIATCLSTKYSPEHIFLFGSATQFMVEKDLPILGKGLSQKDNEEIKLAAHSFAFPVTCVRGTLDGTATQKESLKLFTSFQQSPEKTFIELLGVDHRFKESFGKENLALPVQLKNIIKRLIL